MIPPPPRNVVVSQVQMIDYCYFIYKNTCVLTVLVIWCGRDVAAVLMVVSMVMMVIMIITVMA